jgi:hypothetical protein
MSQLSNRQGNRALNRNDKRELVFRASHITITIPLWDKFSLLALVRGARLGDCDYCLLYYYYTYTNINTYYYYSRGGERLPLRSLQGALLT